MKKQLFRRLTQTLLILAMIWHGAVLKAQTSIPGKVEAENYTSGGSGVGINSNSNFSGGKAVNNFAPGQSLGFSVNVSTAGTYNIELRVGTQNYCTGKVTFSGNSASATFNITPTGGYGTMASFTVNNVTLAAGTQTMTLANQMNYFDVDYINVTSNSATVAVTGVTIVPTSISIVTGGTGTLTATVAPANATNQNITWTTSNAAVATVSTAGVVTAVAVGSANITASSAADATKKDVCAVTVTAPTSSANGDGNVVFEKWTGVSGTALSNNDFTKAPNNTTSLTKIEIPVNSDDNYAARIRGYIIPSTTGSYNLYIASDDEGQLWLSTNDQPANKAKVANVSSWTNSQEWAKEANQKSAAISLTAGTKYYFEALMKEGGGGDNLAIGWTGPGISTITIPSGVNINSYTSGPTSVAVTSVSLDITSITLDVNATQQLTATISPSNATDKSVRWSTSNSSVATVTSAGVVSGIAAGTANIAVTSVSDNTKSDVCSVTVKNGNSVPTGEQITNPGFESNYTAWADDGKTAITSTSGDVHTGSKALQHTIGKGGVHSATNILLSGANMVTFSGWAKRTGSNWCGFGLDYVDGSGTVKGKITFDVASSATTYTQYTNTSVVPAGATACRIWTWKDDSAATMIIDDLSVLLKLDNTPPTAPTGLTAGTVACTIANLSWTASTDANGVVGYKIYNGTALLMSTGNVTTTSLSGLTPATTYSDVKVKAIDLVGNESGASNSISITTTNANCGSDFVGVGYDIGAVGVAGKEQIDLSAGKYQIWGAGNEVDNAMGYGDNDALHYYAIKASGDFQLTARVVNMDYTSYHAKAGVMVRGTLDANARNGFMYIAKGQPYYQWGYRWYNGGPGKTSGTFATAYPFWVRVVKTDDAVSGWWSTDGVNWNNDEAAENIYVQTDTVYIGLAVCSYNTGTAALAEFDNVKFEKLTFPNPAYTAKPAITNKIGTNLWYLYSCDAQKDPATWTGANVFTQANPDFTQADPWNHAFVNNLQIYSVLRFMDWAATNGSTAKDWTKRTLKTDPYQGSWDAGKDQPRGVTTVGVAWDWMMDLCNRTSTDMWINIPHLTIDPADFTNGDDFNNEFALKLAILIKTGVDMKAVDLKSWVGGKGNLTQLANKSAQDFINAGGVKTCNPLGTNQKVYVEYSNEMWMRQQADYGYSKASAAGLSSTDQFAAWAEVRSWRAFECVFGINSSRLVKIAGPMAGVKTDAEVNTLFTSVYDNAGKNPWLTKPNAWKLDSYINPGYRLGGGVTYGNDPNVIQRFQDEVTQSVNAITAFKNSMKTNHNIPIVSYEGGQHFERYAGEFNSNPKSYDAYLDWAKRLTPVFDVAVHYTHYGKWRMNQQEIFANWGAMWSDRQPIEQAHKYRALRDWATGTAKAANEAIAIKDTSVVSNNGRLMIYPNPIAQGNNLKIQASGITSNDVFVNVYDITGKVILQQKLTGQQEVFEINTNGLQKGMYIFNVSSQNQTLKSQLIVK